MLEIIIHHSAVFSTLLKHKYITENKKIIIYLQGRIQEFLIFFVFFGGDGGSKFWFKKDR